MARRIIFICVWTVVFLTGTSALIGLVAGTSSAVGVETGHRLNDRAISWIGMTLALEPLLVGAIGLVLGILGLLPGPSRKKVH